MLGWQAVLALTIPLSEVGFALLHVPVTFTQAGCENALA
jgi:hypothetical protein